MVDLSASDTWLYYFLSATAQALAGATGLVGAFAAFRINLVDRAIIEAAGIVKKRADKIIDQQGNKGEMGVYRICAQQDYEFLPTKIRLHLATLLKDQARESQSRETQVELIAVKEEIQEVATAIDANYVFRRRLSRGTLWAVILNAIIVFLALVALRSVGAIVSTDANWRYLFLIVCPLFVAGGLFLLVRVVWVSLGGLPPTMAQLRSRVQEARELAGEAEPGVERGDLRAYNRSRVGHLCRKIAKDAPRLGIPVPDGFDPDAGGLVEMLQQIEANVGRRDHGPHGSSSHRSEAM